MHFSPQLTGSYVPASSYSFSCWPEKSWRLLPRLPIPAQVSLKQGVAPSLMGASSQWRLPALSHSMGRALHEHWPCSLLFQQGWSSFPADWDHQPLLCSWSNISSKAIYALCSQNQMFIWSRYHSGTLLRNVVNSTTVRWQYLYT